MKHEEKSRSKKLGAQGRIREPSSDLISFPYKTSEQPQPRQAEFATNRCNVKGGLVSEDKRARIIKTLKESVVPLNCQEIARKTKINPSTVRSYLTRLKKEDKIVTIMRGFYTVPENLAAIRGVGYVGGLEGVSGIVLDRIHRLELKGCVEVSVAMHWYGRKPKVVYDSVYLRVRVSGYQNGTVMVYVDCKNKYSLGICGGFRLLVDLLCLILGVDVWQFKLVCPEFNHDFGNVELRGFKNITLKELDGNFFRMYQMKTGVRVEARYNTEVEALKLEALISGGRPAYRLAQVVGVHIAKVKELIEAQKFANELLNRSLHQNERLLKVNEVLLKRLLKEENSES